MTRKVRSWLARRALGGERSAAIDLLVLLQNFLDSRTSGEVPHDAEVNWQAAPFEYLREAIDQILQGIPADVALGLVHGDPGPQKGDPFKKLIRQFVIHAKVEELIRTGKVTSKTAAFKWIATHTTDFPSIDGTSKNAGRLAWTTIRDEYNRAQKQLRL
ncbi:MAG: hypothetical protein KDI74_04770 [Gammaproteobacteria bacterium]|nr:hypothetical protein [Gammaproteobacteria bacterium]